MNSEKTIKFNHICGFCSGKFTIEVKDIDNYKKYKYLCPYCHEWDSLILREITINLLLNGINPFKSKREEVLWNIYETFITEPVLRLRILRLHIKSYISKCKNRLSAYKNKILK